MTYPPLSLISISRTFKPEERNAANSQFFAVMSLVGIVTPMLTGTLADLIGLRYVFGLLIIFVSALAPPLIRRNAKAVDEATRLVM